MAWKWSGNQPLSKRRTSLTYHCIIMGWCVEVNLFDLVNNESHTSLHLQIIQIFMLFSQAQLVNYPVIKNLLISSVCPNEINCTFRNTITNNSAWLYIKMLSYQYRKYHCRDKTVTRSSYLHNGISYIGKMASLYWISHLVAKTYKDPFSTWMSKVLVNERMYVCMYITSLINYDLAQSQKTFPDLWVRGETSRPQT